MTAKADGLFKVTEGGDIKVSGSSNLHELINLS